MMATATREDMSQTSPKATEKRTMMILDNMNVEESKQDEYKQDQSLYYSEHARDLDIAVEDSRYAARQRTGEQRLGCRSMIIISHIAGVCLPVGKAHVDDFKSNKLMQSQH
jgi:hypothetical protein